MVKIEDSVREINRVRVAKYYDWDEVGITENERKKAVVREKPKKGISREEEKTIGKRTSSAGKVRIVENFYSSNGKK